MFRIFVLMNLLATAVMANEAPPIPEGGLQVIYSNPCSDLETDEKGMCHLLQDKNGRTYLAFWQADVLMFIREIVGDSYTTIWVNDQYNSI